MRRSSAGHSSSSFATVCVVGVHPVSDNIENVTSVLRRESVKRTYQRQKQFNEKSVGHMSFHFLTIVFAVVVIFVSTSISEMMLLPPLKPPRPHEGGRGEDSSKTSTTCKSKAEASSSPQHLSFQAGFISAGSHEVQQINATEGQSAIPSTTTTRTITAPSPDGRTVTKTTMTTTRQMPLPGNGYGSTRRKADTPPRLLDTIGGHQSTDGGGGVGTITIQQQQRQQIHHQHNHVGGGGQCVQQQHQQARQVHHQGQCVPQNQARQQVHQNPNGGQCGAKSQSRIATAAPTTPSTTAVADARARLEEKLWPFAANQEASKRMMMLLENNPQKMEEEMKELISRISKVTQKAEAALEKIKATLITKNQSSIQQHHNHNHNGSNGRSVPAGGSNTGTTIYHR